MRILHVLNHSIPYVHGYSSRSKYIVGFQKKLGLDPIVVTSARHVLGTEVEDEIDGIRYFRTRALDSTYGLMQMKIPFLRERRLMKHLQRNVGAVAKHYGVDLIHAHSPVLCGIPSLRVARELGLKFVYEVRSLWEESAVHLGKFGTRSLRYRLARRTEDWLMSNADCVVCICEGLKKEIARRGIDEDKIEVVENGVDTEKFRPRPRHMRLAQAFGLVGGPVFGFIGSFYPGEGLDLLLQAWPKIHQSNKNARLMLVGGGPEEERLKKLVASMDNGSDGVIFAGRVPHEKILDVYSLIDVFIYPRQKNRLNDTVTPLKPLEAMAMEKTVIASDVGGLKELIKDQETGFLYRAGDIDDLVKCCLTSVANEELVKALGRAARERMVQSRSWANLVRQYLDIYDSLGPAANDAEHSVAEIDDRLGTRLSPTSQSTGLS